MRIKREKIFFITGANEINQIFTVKKLNGLFKKAVHLIAMHPHIGRSTDSKNIRVKPVRDYLIIYEDTPTRIEILSIWDTRRDPEELQKRIS